MSLHDRLKPLLKILKLTSIWGSGGLFLTYHFTRTFESLNKVINTNVLDRERKHNPEYIYIDDPSYNVSLQIEKDRETKRSVGFTKIWKSLKHSLAWRLLWLCRHGNREQRNMALERLAAFKDNKHWDYLKLAQAMDKNTAVLLARTRGADLRFFLPPPIHIRKAALSTELVSFKLRNMIRALQSINSHSCLKKFLNKYFANIKEQALDADSIPTKPDNISERDLCILCLNVLHHHISLFNSKNYDEDLSIIALINMGLLPKLTELLLRNCNDVEMDMAVFKILTVLSVHYDLLPAFFQNGLIGELAKFLRSNDIRLSSSAAVCLANLSGEYCYRPGLYLLHPIYRTNTPQSCDTLLVHGLRGGVFVTWRQRDRKDVKTNGILEENITDVDCDSCNAKIDGTKYLDLELKQVVKDSVQLDDEALLADLEVVLHDLPILAKRESSSDTYTANKKRTALIQENQDNCNYNLCWPKEWLPKDCSNLRILGVNYFSSLSDWSECCPLQTADITKRAAELGDTLVDAGVGKKGTPIVWLAHSMGGLIVKQVLIDAAQSNKADFKRLSYNTKAIIFYSTPHKGSTLATMPRAAEAVLWPSNDVKQLKVHSPVLLEMHKYFIEIADKYKWETISFAETMPTIVTAFKVPIHFVESFSADLGRGVFYQLPLDHLSICKPATRQSILYTTVLDVLQRVTSKEELKYANPIEKWVMEFMWWVLQRKANGVLETIDENQRSNRLRWFEKILLDSLTDIFTD